MTDKTKYVVITEANFAESVLKAEKPVVLYFWHETCGPCKTTSPKVDKLAQEYGDRVTVCKSNIHDWSGAAEHFKIFGVPRILVLCQGEVKGQIVGGGHPVEKMKSIIDEAIAPCKTETSPVNEVALKAKAEFDAIVEAAAQTLEKDQLDAWRELQAPHKELFDAAAEARKPISDEIDRRLAETTAKRDKGEMTEDDWVMAFIKTMTAVEAEPAYKDALEKSQAAQGKLSQALEPYHEKYEQSLANAEAAYDKKVAEAKAQLAAATAS